MLAGGILDGHRRDNGGIMEGYRRPPGGLSEDFRRACEGISRGAHKGLAEETGRLLQGSRRESYGKNVGGLPEATCKSPGEVSQSATGGHPGDTRGLPEHHGGLQEVYQREAGVGGGISRRTHHLLEQALHEDGQVLRVLWSVPLRARHRLRRHSHGVQRRRVNLKYLTVQPRPV